MKFEETQGTFSVGDLVDYENGKVVKMTVMRNATMALIVMAFDADTELPEHRAPGEALFSVIEGEISVRMNGNDYVVTRGRSIRFEKGGSHAVIAAKRAKVALLLNLA